MHLFVPGVYLKRLQAMKAPTDELFLRHLAHGAADVRDWRHGSLVVTVRAAAAGEIIGTTSGLDDSGVLRLPTEWVRVCDVKPGRHSEKTMQGEDSGPRPQAACLTDALFPVSVWQRPRAREFWRTTQRKPPGFIVVDTAQPNVGNVQNGAGRAANTTIKADAERAVMCQNVLANVDAVIMHPSILQAHEEDVDFMDARDKRCKEMKEKYRTFRLKQSLLRQDRRLASAAYLQDVVIRLSSLVQESLVDAFDANERNI